jgi:hypothetical protein
MDVDGLRSNVHYAGGYSEVRMHFRFNILTFGFFMGWITVEYTNIGH